MSNQYPTPGPVELTGYEPTYQRVSDFQFGEIQTLAGPRENVIDLAVPEQTPSRKIYCWIWAANSNSNWWVRGFINFYLAQSFMGQLPVAIGGGTFGNQSLPSVCTTNGSNVQDCLGVYVVNPTGSQPTSLILQPLYIVGQFDRLTLSVKDASGISSIRAMLACISSQK